MMSRFWIYLKTNVRADLKQVHILIGTFILIPLFFTWFMGFSFSSAFVPETSVEPIQISVQNEDVGEAGELFNEMLTTEEMEEYIDVVEEEEADFNVHIQPEYSENFEETPLTIEAQENSSSSEETMLTQLITDWQQAIVDQEALMAEVASIEDPQVVNNLMTSLEEINEFDVDTLFNTQSYASDAALTSNQFTSVTGLMYILLLTLAGSAQLSTNEDLKGTRKRMDIIPLSPKNKVLYDIGTNTIIYTVLTLIYVVIWRLIDANTFAGNPLFYIFWILIYTLFFQAINQALLYIVPDKLTTVFYQVPFILYMIFGFIPIDRMVGGEFGEMFSQNFVRLIFNQPLYDFMVNQEITGNLLIAGGLLAASLIIMIFTIRIKRRRELEIV